MANIELSIREWKILKLALDELHDVSAVVDGHSVTLAEFNHVYDRVMAGMGEDLKRIEDENKEYASSFSADDAEQEARHKMQLASAKKLYTGVERRKS